MPLQESKLARMDDDLISRLNKVLRVKESKEAKMNRRRRTHVNNTVSLLSPGICEDSDEDKD